MAEIGSKNSKRTFLERRNALWFQLRLLEGPQDISADPQLEEVISELMALTKLSREQVWAGLGWETQL